MTRLTIIAAVIMSIVGCVSSGPAAQVEGAGDVTQTDAGAAVEPGADSDVVAGIEMMEAPAVEQVTAVAETRDEMVCRLERLTGSHRLEKFCRPRSQIEEEMRETQQVMREMGMRTNHSGPAK